jgi:hypothetical protein
MAAITKFKNREMDLPDSINRYKSRSIVGTRSQTEVHLFQRRLVVKASSVGRNERM